MPGPEVNRGDRLPFSVTVGPPPPDLDRRVRRVSVRSSVLGVRKALFVYIPETRRPDERFPVLYLLRGHEREWLNNCEDATRRGNVLDVYLRLLRVGTVGRMILIFPGLTSDDGRVHGLATDFAARSLAPDVAGLGTARFESYFVGEVIPLIDALFPTLPGDRHRGVDGFSLGGLMAVKLAAKFPHLFASAGSYDGTFLYAGRDGAGMQTDDRVYRAGIFDAVFGRPRDHAFAAANNPANLILRAHGALERVQWLIQSGPERREPWASNFYRGAYLRACLAARGLRSAIAPVIDDGSHDWATADRHMEQTLPLHWAALAGEAE